MNEQIIHIENLCKTYRLYHKPHHRFLDMFGLLKRSIGYSEHAALKNVNLTIHRGEKVGFIGRNGAGKSTLLKIISGVCPETTGTVQVNAGLHALLQIGTGFHPEFTGRENAASYLAHLGVSKAEMELKINEIIAFSELENFIDQPVKFYSSGMMARLMFSTSTVISPDLLALDEILGVGDAYFAVKSYEKMVELASSEKTTVILVSHDIYAVSQICDRIIWLDNGSVLMDDKADIVISAYEDSIKLQEEARLRTKAANSASSGWGTKCVIEFLPAENDKVILADFRLFNIILSTNDSVVVDKNTEGFLDAEHMDKISSQGVRLLEKASSVSRELLVVNLNENLIQKISSSTSEVGFEYTASSDVKINLRFWIENRCVAQSLVNFKCTQMPEKQKDKVISKNQRRKASSKINQNQSKIWTGASAIGSGVVKLFNFDCLSSAGHSMRVFSSDDKIRFSCDYELLPDGEDELPVQILLCFRGTGQKDYMRVFSEQPILLSKRGTLVIDIKENWHIANGEYRIVVIVVKPGYYLNSGNKFFTINDDVYFFDGRALNISIESNNPVLENGAILTETGVVVHTPHLS